MLKENRQIVPCGVCAECLKRRRKEWYVRCWYELKDSSNAWFITLTYDDEHLPHVPGTGEETLSKRDIQLFMKNLRHRLKRKFKYYVVGEYGEKRERPHYHLLLFNGADTHIEMHNALNATWTKGLTHIGVVKEPSINYCLDYMIQNYQVDGEGKQKPFALMSTKPPIGVSYVEKRKKWHLQDSSRFYSQINGIKYPLPRLFKEMIYCDTTRKARAKKFELEHIDRCIKQMHKDEHLHPSLEMDRKEATIRNLKSKSKKKL